MYKAIKDFPAYIIYDDGRVYSTKTNQFMSVGKDDRGYSQISFYQNGKAASGTNKLATSNAIVVTYE